jgi:ABC-type nitrate/sulfonate/bicarbonate transport system substrate-binding protein
MSAPRSRAVTTVPLVFGFSAANAHEKVWKHGMPQAVLAKPEIKTPADLRGETIANASPDSLPDLLIRRVLDAEKIPQADMIMAAVPVASVIDASANADATKLAGK